MCSFPREEDDSYARSWLRAQQRLKAKTVGILAVESSSLEVLKRPGDVALGTWFSRRKVGLDDLRQLFQPQGFCDSMTFSQGCPEQGRALLPVSLTQGKASPSFPVLRKTIPGVG